MNELVRPSGNFAERMSRFLERVEYVRVETPELLDSVQRLRHQAYLREGAILPRSDQRVEDAFDHSANAVNFAVFVDGRLTSALRLVVLSANDPRSPAQECFADRLDPAVAADKVIVDPNRFVADYGLARVHPHLPYATLRLSVMLAAHVDADLMTCAVRSEHRAFYRREFLAESICAPRPYPTLTKPLGLMLINFRRDRDAIVRGRAVYDSTPEERSRLFAGAPPWPERKPPAKRIAQTNEM